MRIDDSLKITAQILSSNMRTTPLPLDQVADELDRLHKDVMRIQAGSYVRRWEDELTPLDVIDQAEIDRIQPRSFPPPTNPLAEPEVSVADKVAGTVFPDRIECLECGKSNKLMKSHLQTSHNRMTWAEYLDRHGLADDYPAASAAHVERQRADQRRLRGLGEASADGGEQKNLGC